MSYHIQYNLAFSLAPPSPVRSRCAFQHRDGLVNTRFGHWERKERENESARAAEEILRIRFPIQRIESVRVLVGYRDSTRDRNGGGGIRPDVLTKELITLQSSRERKGTGRK